MHTAGWSERVVDVWPQTRAQPLQVRVCHCHIRPAPNFLAVHDKVPNVLRGKRDGHTLCYCSFSCSGLCAAADRLRRSWFRTIGNSNCGGKSPWDTESTEYRWWTQRNDVGPTGLELRRRQSFPFTTRCSKYISTKRSVKTDRQQLQG
jgi:hypothetical protein